MQKLPQCECVGCIEYERSQQLLGIRSAKYAEESCCIVFRQVVSLSVGRGFHRVLFLLHVSVIDELKGAKSSVLKDVVIFSDVQIVTSCT